MDSSSFPAMSSSLQTELKTVSEKCINCKLCQKECEFLRRYGKPQEIADAYESDIRAHQTMAFECSLCQLCTAVCPVDINPADMFLEMRREAVRHGGGVYPEHAGRLGYEQRGTSRRYSWYGLPEGCDSILFPGCTLPGTRPDKTLKLFEYMKQQIPSLGIVLDCCTKPSCDLGRESHFHSMFNEMQGFLLKNGIKSVFVACPNCYKIFKKFSKELAVKTVYEFMSENGLPNKIHLNEIVTIHDPCAVRFESSIQSAVRDLVRKQGLTLKEMPHSGEKTICCGEGGDVCSVAPGISGKWGKLREQETNGNRAITYCASCASLLNKSTPTSHILDLLFEPECTLKGKAKVSQAPVTYWNRLRLKKQLKSTLDTAVSRERTFSTRENGSKASTSVRIIVLLLIIGAIVALHLTGRGMSRATLLKTLAVAILGLSIFYGASAFAEVKKNPDLKIVKGASKDLMIVDTTNKELRISALVTKDVTKPSMVDWGQRFQAFFGAKGGKMEEFFVFTTDVSRVDINNAILELGIKSRRQIPFEEVGARCGLKPTTTEDDYLNGDPVIVTICFAKDGKIVESAMEDMIQEKILVENQGVIKPYTPHFIYHGTGEALNFPSGCIICPSDCNGGIITDNALPLKTALSYYKVNWDRMPLVGSKVEIVIKSIYGTSRLLSIE